ncbi:protein HAIKU1-like [Durio zibethinus]|uniref:Protein HAIKU1-like n=1 Tax=Durio zibethinus TaxID=66656 RepID=A0A6P5YCQ2_DURZI|nr:protein HAIKU1-like [Durio zibethinus]XP_022738156.1 protein HAIKU1-like [Durio zibethinus]XP_022738157.1 protein HAIKU1-like [Durio zibethinus]XP_022738159.1 protein HAIKU1-like [Durio zibethinus]
MDNSKNRLNDHLGVNKISKNIKKSPLHQPNFANNAARQQPQPQVYNISKNDFRNIVQQLTGSPSRNDPLPRPPQNPPKPQSMRLQKIRPPPLTPINRPHILPPAPVPAPAYAPAPVPHPAPYNNSLVRPGQYGQPSPKMLPPMIPGDAVLANTAESSISAYMRYLQASLIDPSPVGNQVQPHLHPPVPGRPHAPPPYSGLLPNPPTSALPSPRAVNGPAPLMPNLHSPRMNGPVQPMPNLPSPWMNGAALLPSPTSQFLLPSPTGYMNLLSPHSPYPLLSPGIQFPPITPNFAFSPMGQSGILGPGPQPPPSPGLVFPLSPSGLFPFPSPRWRDQ